MAGCGAAPPQWTGPVVKPRNNRGGLGGAALVFFAAFAVFSASYLSARWMFPRAGGQREEVQTVLSEMGELEVVSLPEVEQQYEEKEEEEDMLLSSLQLHLGAGFATEMNQYDDDKASSLPRVTTTTEECTGDRTLPVVKGADFVAFRSLAEGEPAVYGSEQFSSEFNDYLFFFSSEENKLIFESDPTQYVPAWGGFCAYGIAHEVIWNPYILGPTGEPDYWWRKDGVLYLFLNAAAMEAFVALPQINIDHGRAIWREWFGDKAMTIFNTACF